MAANDERCGVFGMGDERPVEGGAIPVCQYLSQFRQAVCEIHDPQTLW